MKYWRCLYLALFVKSANSTKIKQSPNIGVMQYLGVVGVRNKVKLKRYELALYLPPLYIYTIKEPDRILVNN